MQQFPLEFCIDTYGQQQSFSTVTLDPCGAVIILLESRPRRETNYWEYFLHCSVMGIPINAAAKELGTTPEHLRANVLRSLKKSLFK